MGSLLSSLPSLPSFYIEYHKQVRASGKQRSLLSFENEPLKISVVPVGSSSVPISKNNSTRSKVGLQSSKILNNSSDRQPSVDAISIPDREPIRQFDSRKDTELASPLTDASSPRKLAGGAGNTSRESSVIIKSRSGTVLQRQNSRQALSKKLNSTVIGPGSNTERSSNGMNTSIVVTDRTGSPVSPQLHHSASVTTRPSMERGSAGFSIVEQTLNRYVHKQITGASQPSAEELSTSRHQEMFRNTATDRNKKLSEASWKRNLHDSQMSGKVKLSLLRRDSEKMLEKSQPDVDLGLLIDTAHQGGQTEGAPISPSLKYDDVSTDKPRGGSTVYKPDPVKPGYFSKGGLRSGNSMNSNVFKSRDKSPDSPTLAKSGLSSDPRSKRFLEGKSNSLSRGDSTGKSSDKPSQAYYLGKLESRGSNSRQSAHRFTKSPSLTDAPNGAGEVDSPKFKVTVLKQRQDTAGTGQQKEANEIRLIKNSSLVDHRTGATAAPANFRSTAGPGTHWASNSTSHPPEEASSVKKEQVGSQYGRSLDSKPAKDADSSKMRNTMNHSFLNKFNLENVIKKLKAEETTQQNEGPQTSTQVSANHSLGQQQSNYLAVNTTSKQAFKRTNRARGTKNNLLRSVFPNSHVAQN